MAAMHAPPLTGFLSTRVAFGQGYRVASGVASLPFDFEQNELKKVYSTQDASDRKSLNPNIEVRNKQQSNKPKTRQNPKR
jgi:hypothetical protein